MKPVNVRKNPDDEEAESITEILTKLPEIYEASHVTEEIRNQRIKERNTFFTECTNQSTGQPTEMTKMEHMTRSELRRKRELKTLTKEEEKMLRQEEELAAKEMREILTIPDIYTEKNPLIRPRVSK